MAYRPLHAAFIKFMCVEEYNLRKSWKYQHNNNNNNEEEYGIMVLMCIAWHR